MLSLLPTGIPQLIQHTSVQYTANATSDTSATGTPTSPADTNKFTSLWDPGKKLTPFS